MDRASAGQPRSSSLVSGRTLVLLVFLFAVVRLVHHLIYAGYPFYWQPHLDGEIYLQWATSIARDEEPQFGYIFNPLYPHFLAVLMRVFDDILVPARVAQALLSLGTMVCGVAITRRLFGPTAALVSGLFLALYGPLLLYESFLLIEALNVFLISLSTTCLLWLLPAPGDDLPPARRRALLLAGVAGLSGGLAAVARPTYLLALPAYLLLLLLGAPRGQQLTRLRTAPPWVLVLGFSLVVAVPILRNYGLSGKVTPVTSGYGIMLYQGNNPSASGTSSAPAAIGPAASDPHRSSRAYTAHAERVLGRQLVPEEVSRFYVGESLDFVLTQPGRWIALELHKARLFWSGYELNDHPNAGFQARFSPLLRLPLFNFYWLGPLSLLGLLGLLWERRGRLDPAHLALLVPVAIAFASALVFIVVGRYRLAAIPSLVPLLAWAALRWLRLLRGRRLALAGGWLLAALLLRLGLGLTVYSQSPAPDYVRLGHGYMAAGDPEQAGAAYEAALAHAPENPQATNNLALAYELQGRGAEALALWRRLRESPQATDRHRAVAARHIRLLEAAGIPR